MNRLIQFGHRGESTLSQMRSYCLLLLHLDFLTGVLKCHKKTFQIHLDFIFHVSAPQLDQNWFQQFQRKHLWERDEFLWATLCCLSVTIPFILLLLMPTFIVMTSYITAIHFSRVTLWKSKVGFTGFYRLLYDDDDDDNVLLMKVFRIYFLLL